MAGNPRFQRRFDIEVVPDEGVYLFSERGEYVLEGAIVQDLVPYLQGRHRLDEVAEALGERYERAEVYFAVDSLRRKGYVCDADPEVDSQRAAFWELAGLDGDRAEATLRQAVLEIKGVGDVDLRPAVEAAGSMGLTVGEGPGSFLIVVTDDYLNPALEELNREAIGSGRPWLLGRPLGSTVWIGPVFRPGVTGCWRCLAQRARTNRQVETYVEERSGRRAPLKTALGGVPVSHGVAANLLILEAARWLTSSSQDFQAAVITFDLLTMESQRHPVPRRPQCPGCGDPELQANLQRRPIELQSRRKQFVADGGHRSAPPEEVVSRYRPLVSPITGVVSRLAKVPAQVDLVQAYSAGHNFAVQVPSLRFLREGLRTRAAGKGMTDIQAQASGLCEAMERYSGLFHGDEAREPSSYRELGDAAIHPNECTLFSERQYRERDEWNARGSTFSTVADPFDEDATIDWSPVWSLTESRHRYLPTMYLYYHYPKFQGSLYCWADSNGNAAGTSLEDAVLQGLLELVERDSAAIWWYNRLTRPAVDLAQFDEPYLERFVRTYREVHREVWVLDLTTDLGIASVAAVSRRIDKPVEDILVSFGAHLDPRIAVLRALTEMNQFLPAVLPIKSDGSGDYAFPDPDQRRWWKTATVANQPYLLPDPSQKASRLASRDVEATADLREDVLSVQARIERAGSEVLVLDQTRPDIGLPVVKTIAPGLRHFWARFAPGRLYEAPVQAGWLDRPRREEDLNPIPMFI
jgi:ribosomal protein S12 methylthiotransferase accessory factor